MKLSNTDRSTLATCREPIVTIALDARSVKKLLQFGYIREFVRDNRFHVELTEKGKSA